MIYAIPICTYVGAWLSGVRGCLFQPAADRQTITDFPCPQTVGPDAPSDKLKLIETPHHFLMSLLYTNSHFKTVVLDLSSICGLPELWRPLPSMYPRAAWCSRGLHKSTYPHFHLDSTIDQYSELHDEDYG